MLWPPDLRMVWPPDLLQRMVWPPDLGPWGCGTSCPWPSSNHSSSSSLCSGSSSHSLTFKHLTPGIHKYHLYIYLLRIRMYCISFIITCSSIKLIYIFILKIEKMCHTKKVMLMIFFLSFCLLDLHHHFPKRAFLYTKTGKIKPCR